MVQNIETPRDLMSLLAEATAREMKVAMQYMMQHTLYIGGDSSILKAAGFVASHRSIFLPGKSLKKIAITEMKHAEAIAERISNLGGKPPTESGPLMLGKTVADILQIDKAEEEFAIKLYKQVIDIAGKDGDIITEKLFVKILSDEEEHHRTFVSLLTETK
jgi:bacterioferritin